MNQIILDSFADELQKIARSKEHTGKLAEEKQAGEQISGRDYFISKLEDVTKTRPRGPHPALNYEAQR